MVTMTFKDDDTPANVLEDATVKLYVNGQLYRQGTSDADGVVLFDDIPVGLHTAIVGLPYRPGYAISNPYALLVVADENVQFDFVLHRAVEPTGNTWVCVCSGYFFDAAGELVDDASIRFRPVGVANVMGPSGILGKEIGCPVIRGYAEISLLRGAAYRVDIPWFRPDNWQVTVPDKISANLPDVLFPVLYSVEYSPASLSMEVGDTVKIDVTAVYKSGLRATGDVLGADWPVFFVVDNSASVQIIRGEDGRLEARALHSGTARISALREDVDQPVQAVPDVWVGGSLDIVVS